jgi:anti-sigma factor RsiW
MAYPRPPFPPACERARVWVSQELDDELSELELAALRAHLGGCPGCAAFAQSVAAVTGELRAAPLLVSARTLAPPSLRGRGRQLFLGVAAASVAAAVAIGAGVGSLTRGTSAPVRTQPNRAAIAATQEPYLEQSLLAMLAHLKPPSGRTVAV